MSIWLDKVVSKFSKEEYLCSLVTHHPLLKEKMSATRRYLQKKNNPLTQALTALWLSGLLRAEQDLKPHEEPSGEKREAPFTSRSLLMADTFEFLYKAASIEPGFPLFTELSLQQEIIHHTFNHTALIALKPSAQLIADFLHTDPPPADYQEVLSQRCFYIDLPEDILQVEGVAIKAIFFDNQHISAYSNFSDQPYHKMRYLQFIFKDGHLITNYPTPHVSHALHVIFNLTILLMLYYESDQKKLAAYPFISSKALEKINVKKQSAKLKKYSLFKLVQIERPLDTKQWHYGGKENLWNLTQRISVRGHWRWQPYGKSKKKRKIIWIDNYFKGDGNDKLDLTKLA